MTRVGWGNEAWQPIADYESVWGPFDERFPFRAGMDPERWPAIREPAGSATFDLSEVFARSGGGFAADEDAVNQQVLRAMTAVFGDDTPLIALDWQHTSYWFWPHRHAALSEPWRIPPFPTGDYFALVTQDLDQGTFGHPWEQTLCVFGADLAPALGPQLEEWLPVTRRRQCGVGPRTSA